MGGHHLGEIAVGRLHLGRRRTGARSLASFQIGGGGGGGKATGAVHVKTRWARIYIVLMAWRVADWNVVTVSAWTARCGRLFHVGIHLT